MQKFISFFLFFKRRARFIEVELTYGRVHVLQRTGLRVLTNTDSPVVSTTTGM